MVKCLLIRAHEGTDALSIVCGVMVVGPCVVWVVCARGDRIAAPVPPRTLPLVETVRHKMHI